MVLLIETKGDPFTRGKMQGSLLKRRISLNLDALWHSKMFKVMTQNGVPLSFIKMGLGQTGRSKIRRFIVKYFPHHLKKMRGIAKGAGISMNLMFALHYLEVMSGDPQSLYRNPPVQGCSMLFALSNTTSDHCAYYARNYDFPRMLQPFQIVRKEIPEDGRFKNIGLTHHPHIGAHIAMNEKGLVIGYNYGRTWKKNPLDFRLDGIPGTILLQEAIETCETMDDVIQFITKFPARSNGFHFGVLDKDENACVIETTSTRYSIRYPDDGILFHTNTYRTEKMKDANLPMDVKFKTEGMDFSPLKSPIQRYKRLQKLAFDSKGVLSLEAIKSILRDHDSGDPNIQGPSDFSICIHGDSAMTLGSVIAKPKELEFYVVDNLPCKAPFELFHI